MKPINWNIVAASFYDQGHEHQQWAAEAEARGERQIAQQHAVFSVIASMMATALAKGLED